MKQFILGFIVGAVIITAASILWRIMFTPNAISLRCNVLSDTIHEFGDVRVTVLKNNKPVPDLTVLLSIEKPSRAPFANNVMAPIPKKACFINTDGKGVGIFTKVPVGTAFLFFNNDVSSYIKRFGQPSTLVTEVEVKNGVTSTATIDLKD